MLSYSDIWIQFLRNTNQVGSPDTNLLGYFTTQLSQRYSLVLAKLRNYKTVLEYTFNVGMQVTLLSSGVTQTISNITSSATTATVTTTLAHGYTTGNIVAISGVQPNPYNGTFSVTVTGTTTFTYTLLSATTSPGKTAQYYPMPLGEIQIEGMFITVGSVNFPLQIINSRFDWEQLNAILIQASALPQFYFPRQSDFGIWPTPQTVYTGNISYYFRDRPLGIADYTAGSITVTQQSTTITASAGAVFTPAMVGRWLEITDPSVPGQGYGIRITGFIDASNLTLYQPWTAATATTALYRIGEVPEIPDELQGTLIDGVTADFYGGMRKDLQNAAIYENRFWTGDASNTQRKEGDSTIAGGVIGGINRYSSRDDARIIKKKPKLNPLQYKIFASVLSS